MSTAILGTGSYVPEPILTNAELGQRLGVSEDWIVTRTGVRERRVAAAHEATSDLATHAAQRALDSARLTAEDVDVIVVATSTPDQPMPATACLVQAQLGATRAAALDVEAVCTGFVYGLVVAEALLVADPARRTCLVIGADVYSRILDYDDRRTSVLFGDGAGAVVLGKSDEQGILGSTLGADGKLAHLVEIAAGGSRRPPTVDTLSGGEHFFAMRGREVREFIAKLLPELTEELLRNSHVQLSDVALIVPHQANGVMLAEWSDGLTGGPAMIHQTVARYGNTGAASVALTLDDAVRTGRIATGDIVLLMAFGGGVTWGGVTIKWVPPT